MACRWTNQTWCKQNASHLESGRCSRSSSNMRLSIEDQGSATSMDIKPSSIRHGHIAQRLCTDQGKVHTKVLYERPTWCSRSIKTLAAGLPLFSSSVLNITDAGARAPAGQPRHRRQSTGAHSMHIWSSCCELSCFLQVCRGAGGVLRPHTLEGCHKTKCTQVYVCLQVEALAAGCADTRHTQGR